MHSTSILCCSNLTVALSQKILTKNLGNWRKKKQTQSNVSDAVLHAGECWDLRGHIGGHILK